MNWTGGNVFKLAAVQLPKHEWHSDRHHMQTARINERTGSSSAVAHKQWPKNNFGWIEVNTKARKAAKQGFRG